ncbi:MAG TPA: class I SAM-dependent methyltransferase [Bacteroidales bacterium]|nr:class I SAM-dependent methyltransferase [Bacteroidales bacterium]
MSLQLLKSLNGGKTGRLWTFIKEYEGSKEPRICWYPSAGTDFRALMYLHPRYAELNPGSEPDPAPPDIFLFTDYFPWQYSDFLDNNIIYYDDRTSVKVDHIEELPRLHTTLHPELLHFPEGSQATNRAVFLNVRVNSNRLGSMSYPVIYAFAENESFCAEKMIPENAVISHIIHIRYGGGCGGGGTASGIWILNVLTRLKCELFVSDGHFYMQRGDEFAMQTYLSLTKNGSEPEFRELRKIPGLAWSGHGDVTWNLVKSSKTDNEMKTENTNQPLESFPHDNWAECYDYVYERTYGALYGHFTSTSIMTVNGFLHPGMNSILDYGAGTGRLSVPLAQAGHDLIAVEQSLPMLKMLKQKALDLTLTIQTENCKIQEYKGRSADIALCVFTVLNYTVAESEMVKIFGNIHKHLKDNGFLFFDLADLVFFQQGVLFNINKPDFRRFVEILSDRGNNYTYHERSSCIKDGKTCNYEDSFPLRYWTHTEVDEMLSKAGFLRVNQSFPEFNGTGSTYHLYRKV